MPVTAPLEIMVLGTSDNMLTDNLGDVRGRLVSYGERLAHLHALMYSPRQHDFHITALSPRCTFYPTRSRHKLTYVWDAYRIGVRICRTHPIALVNAQDPFATGLAAYLIARRCGVPLMISCHADFFGNPRWRRASLYHRGLAVLGRWLLRRADGFRAVSVQAKAGMVACGVPAELIAVTPTPVGRDIGVALEQARAAGSAASRRDEGTILFVGRLAPQKNVASLVRALALVRRQRTEARLVLVGDGPQRPELERLADELGLREAVEFAGFQPQASILPLYRTCAVFVLPSDYEGLAKVLVEAAVCGAPIVCTTSAAPEELLAHEETGLLVPPNDPAVLAAAILRLLSDPKLAERLGQQAQRRAVEAFDRERQIDAVIQAWIDTVERVQQARAALTPGSPLPKLRERG